MPACSRLRKLKVKFVNGVPREQCCEIIHNHIVECPICKEKFASTDQNCDLNEYEETTIQCDECDSCFKIVDGNWYGWENDDIPKVILIDPPIKESKVEPKEPKYKVDPKLIVS